MFNLIGITFYPDAAQKKRAPLHRARPRPGIAAIKTTIKHTALFIFSPFAIENLLYRITALEARRYRTFRIFIAVLA